MNLCLLVNLGNNARGVHRQCTRVSDGLLPVLPSDRRYLDEVGRAVPGTKGVTDCVREGSRCPVCRGASVICFSRTIGKLRTRLGSLRGTRGFVFVRCRTVRSTRT